MTHAAATTVKLAEEVRVAESDAAGLRGRALATAARDVYATGDHPLALRLAYEAASIPESPGFADSLLAEIAFEPGRR